MTGPSLPRPIGRQREVLYLPAQGHVVVLGTAGSGKTTLAILRSLYLSDQSIVHGGPTLLVTFSRCLVTYMRHMGLAESQHPVDVRNYHHFARGYLASRGRLPWNSICGPDERSRFVSLALADARVANVQSPILRRSERFIDGEFEWIQRHGVVREQDYVEAERTGRAATRVARANRPVMFDLYQRYLAHRGRSDKLYDWNDLASAVRGELQSDDDVRRYRHVVIDEGQDFSPEMLRSLALAVPAEGSLTFFGDMAQQIYGHRISWRSAGLSARNTWRFEDNYRNTRQISRLAIALANMPHFPDDSDLVEPISPVADGPPPVRRAFARESEEIRFVVDRAKVLARTGTTAILFRKRHQERYARALAGATRLHRDLDRWPAGPGLFYGTYHSAKGLEFDSVFLPFLSKDYWPDRRDAADIGEQEAMIRDARLLYVGITRAKSSLILTFTGRLTSLLPTSEGLYQP